MICQWGAECITLRVPEASTVASDPSVASRTACKRPSIGSMIVAPLRTWLQLPIVGLIAAAKVGPGTRKASADRLMLWRRLPGAVM